MRIFIYISGKGGVKSPVPTPVKRARSIAQIIAKSIVYSFATREHTVYDLEAISGDITGGHGGGDWGMMKDLIKLLNGDNGSKSICDIRTSYRNHLIAFAAEKSRVKGTVIDMEEYEKSL